MPRPPNIVWIVTTQWRAQACGYAGDPNARTPCLDALARQAANFSQAVTPHPFGPFARAALLTGVPSPENGVAEYYDPLPPGKRTVARALGELGYRTAWFGKWHLAPRDPAAPLVGEAHARTIVPPVYRGGFSFWEGFESGFQLNHPWLHGSRLPRPTRMRGYQSDVLCDRAGEWIAAQETSARWFVVVSLEPPHPPYVAPAPDTTRDPFAVRLAPNVPPSGDIANKARRELAGYYAHIEATDRAIGRLVRSLPTDTIIVVTSVHGDMHGAHGLFRKGWPHEESVRVPLLIRLPEACGGAEWRGTRAELVSLLDLPRWTARWALGEPFSVPSSDAQHLSMPCVVALPYQCDRVWRGIRTRSRKLAIASVGGSAPVPWLYFDLERDPGELTNLVGDPKRQGEIEAMRVRIEP